MSKTINTDIIVANGVYRLILTFVGASLKGTYNMDDPEDIPLFSIFVYGKDDTGHWNTNDVIASARTHEDARMIRAHAINYATSILTKISDNQKVDLQTALETAI